METELTRIFDALPVLAWIALPDGHADFINRCWREFTGLSVENLSGQGWKTRVHPDDLDDLTASWQLIMASHAPGETEVRLRRYDGEYRWFLFRVNPLRNEAGDIIKWYGISIDIDDRKRAEERLRRSEAFLAEGQRKRQASEEALGALRSELARMAKITSLGALTASIAHEVNQPLSGVITNASTCLRMLAADPPNVEGAIETARRTIRDGHRAADVITRVRALFSRKSATIEPVNLNDATREVIALTQSTLKNNRVTLKTAFDEDLPPVAGDRIQLQQVILNLLLNASEAMQDVDDRPREILLRTAVDEDDQVRLTVRDSGVGFEAESVARMFETFYTTKRSGMGIGLSISQSIIERHQGALRARSHDGPGATFWFAIPRGVIDDNEATAMPLPAARAVASP